MIFQDIRILVAEDSPTQAEMILATLEDCGYRVTVARNGRLALEAALEFAPTLIISDIVMPEMDGYEFCRRAKSHPRLANVPFMLLTSLSDPVDVVRGLECGADNFLVKPYDDRYLLSRVSYMLANGHLRTCDQAQMGVEILFAGNRYFITSDRLQILNLLLSTYETAVQKNRELIEAQDALKALAESLDEKVIQRTAQLQAEVDERRRAQEQLQHSVDRERKLAEQLQQAQKMEAIGRLAGGIAHDFNNLLSVIIGYGEILLEEKDPDSRSHSLVCDIVKAGERAASLTAQLLAFSRKSIVRLQPVDINALVTDLQRMLQRLIGEDITCIVKCDQSLKAVLADPSQVEQVVMNLAVNARDAMPTGGRLIIETSAVRIEEPLIEANPDLAPGDYALLAVTDDGVGMTDEVKARIFEPFFTTKEVGKGTGLGLATTYGIVKQSKGHISVYSELGHGTTFRVYLPIAADSKPEAPPSKPAARPRAPASGAVVLLVEDDEMVRQMSRMILESCGYIVLDASNGEAALEVAKNYSGTIHLLLTDVVMPRIGGRDLYQTMAASRPETRVLFMSGYTDDSLIHLGSQGGARLPLLQKPFTPTALANAVFAALEGPMG